MLNLIIQAAQDSHTPDSQTLDSLKPFYMYFSPPFNRPAQYLLLALLCFICGYGHTADKHSIVVTIKPLYSLVAQLTEGIAQPELLMKNNQSVHHYHMRPSERRLLAEATVVVWTGPGMETQLQKTIQGSDARIITLVDIEGIQLYPLRTVHGHHSHDHDSGIDPHLWLSFDNAEIISRYITGVLVELDIKNKPGYTKNLEKLLAKIRHARQQSSNQLQGLDQPFVSYHDAFQYFEREMKLNHVASINHDDNSGAGLKQLKQLQQTIQQQGIQCLFYQAPKPALLDTFSRRTGVELVELDPLGHSLDNSLKELNKSWFTIMRQLTRSYLQCLSH